MYSLKVIKLIKQYLEKTYSETENRLIYIFKESLLINMKLFLNFICHIIIILVFESKIAI